MNERMGNSPAVAEATRIAAANGGSLAPSREQAVEILRQRGIEPSPTGSPLPAAKAPTYDNGAYDNLHVLNTPLPEGADPAAIVEGGRVLVSALQLDPTTAGAIVRDLAGSPDPDPERVRALVAKTGEDYDQLVALATEALQRAELRAGKPLGIKAEELPPLTLTMLAVARRVQAKHEAQKR